MLKNATHLEHNAAARRQHGHCLLTDDLEQQQQSQRQGEQQCNPQMHLGALQVRIPWQGGNTQ
jgi:hypothetical protein